MFRICAPVTATQDRPIHAQTTRLRLIPELDDWVAEEYRLASVLLEDFQNGEAGYFSFLERRDRFR